MSDWKDTPTETPQLKPVDDGRPLGPKGIRAMQGINDPPVLTSPEPPTVPNAPNPPKPPPEHTPKSAYGEAGSADRVETGPEKTEVRHFSRGEGRFG